MRHSVTGLRIPRAGSIPTTTLEMRTSTHTSRSPIPQVISPVPENEIHEIRSSGSIILGQPFQATTVVDMTLLIEPIIATGTRPTATITRAEVEEGQILQLIYRDYSEIKSKLIIHLMKT